MAKKKSNEIKESALDILISIDNQMQELMSLNIPKRLQNIEDCMDQLKTLPKLLVTIENLEKYYKGAKKYLTMEEAADYLGFTRDSMYHFLRREPIPQHKPHGRRVYILRDDLDLWITSHPTQDSESPAPDSVPQINTSSL